MSIALPTFAQQTNTPDPQLREKLVTAIKKHTDALDKNDAAAVAANFTEDGILVIDEKKRLTNSILIRAVTD